MSLWLFAKAPILIVSFIFTYFCLFKKKNKTKNPTISPWAGHRKSLMGFLFSWHGSWSQCRGWRDAYWFQWEKDQAQSCRCYSCKYSAPPFVSHIAPCATTWKTGTNWNNGVRRRAWPPMPSRSYYILPLKALCHRSGTDNTQHFKPTTANNKPFVSGSQWEPRTLIFVCQGPWLFWPVGKSTKAISNTAAFAVFLKSPSSRSHVSSWETWLPFKN